MKLYDGGAIIIIAVIGVLTSLYSVFKEQPAPVQQVSCKVWFTERTTDGREKSYCADGEAQ